MQYFKTDDPVRDAERYAQTLGGPTLHQCDWCDTEIPIYSKWHRRYIALGLRDGRQQWKEVFICESCLEDALDDLERYKEEA